MLDSKNTYKSNWLNMIRPTLAIDLGSYHTKIADSNNGVVVDKPSCVAVNSSGKYVAYGVVARNMEGRVPKGITTRYPIVKGSVKDVEDATKMLEEYSLDLKRPVLSAYRRIVIAQSTTLSEVAARATDQVVRTFQTKRLYRMSSITAAAIGAGIDVVDKLGTMVVVYGAEQTEIGVISQGTIVRQERLLIGGKNVDDVIRDYMRQEHGINIGLLQAESVKLKLSRTKRTRASSVIFGKDIRSGMPKKVEVNESEIKDLVRVQLRQVGDAIKALLHDTQSELAADVARSGIVFAGGSARLPQLAEVMQSELNIKPLLPKNASKLVCEGALQASLRPNYYRSALSSVGS